MGVVHQRDLALAKRVEAGDRSAGTTVLQRLLPLAGQSARALATGPGGAAEARNLAVVQILHEIASYDGNVSLEAWARRVTSPIVLRQTHQRSSGKRAHQSADSPRLPNAVLDALPRSVSSYLADLTEPTRSMVVLRHTVDHSVSEVAGLCDVSESTITSLLRAANKELRRLICEDVDGDGAPAAPPERRADERWQCVRDAYSCGEMLSPDENALLGRYRARCPKVAAERAVWLALEQLGKSDDDLRVLPATVDAHFAPDPSPRRSGAGSRRWIVAVVGASLLAVGLAGWWTTLRLASNKPGSTKPGSTKPGSTKPDIAAQPMVRETSPTATSPRPSGGAVRNRQPSSTPIHVNPVEVRSGALQGPDGAALASGKTLPRGAALHAVDSACIAQNDAVACFESAALFSLPTVANAGWVEPRRGHTEIRLPASDDGFVVAGARYRGGPQGASAVVDVTTDAWTVDVRKGALLVDEGPALQAGQSASGQI